MTNFKFTPGQVFYIYDCFYRDHGTKYYGCLVTRVTPKRVFFTIQGEDFQIKSYAVRGTDENGDEYGNCHSYLIWFDKNSLQNNPDTVLEPNQTTSEPCTTVETPQDVAETTSEPTKVAITEPQDLVTESIETNNPVIVSSETPINDETYAGILKAFDLDIYCGESVKQGHREYFAPVPRFDIHPQMYFIVSANIGEQYDKIFSVKKLNHPTPALTPPNTPSAPNNVIKVDFAARRRKA